MSFIVSFIMSNNILENCKIYFMKSKILVIFLVSRTETLNVKKNETTKILNIRYNYLKHYY